MQNKIGVLLTAVFVTSTASADGIYNNVSDFQNWERSPASINKLYSSETQRATQPGGETRGPSKEDVLKYLYKKKARGTERMLLIEKEISCIQNAQEGDNSIWRCYEIAQQRKQQLKQKIKAQTPYKKRNRQRSGVMPNFDGMGMMPTPW
ncbi:MAG: hypothetical protein HOK42_12300 [Candidatus Marinimicrobia bacterium]|jgi:hypothetical protein|nr:hypothetical protein [Candidatus Neomarinimicrobiota bacterium]